MIKESPNYLSRAMAAYFRAGNTTQPANDSQEMEVGGKTYVVLRNISGVLAVYRVRNDGVLKGLKRWPSAIV